LAVRAGTLDALGACEHLLDTAALDSQGMLAPGAGDLDAGKRVLNHFYDVYRSWFSVQRFDEAVPLFEFTRFTWDLYDSTVGGLFLAYAAFGMNAQYRSVVTHPNPIWAYRAVAGPPVYTAAGPLSRAYIDNSPPFTFRYQTGFKYDP